MVMVYAVYEFNGRDDVLECYNVEDANEYLDQIHAVNKGGKPLGYMTDADQIDLANIHPKIYGDDQYFARAELFYRIRKAVERHKQKYQDG